MDDVRIPTLPDLLAILSLGQGAPRSIFVELKTDPAGYEESADPITLLDATLRDLEKSGWTNHAKIIAFDWSLLRELRVRKPEMACAHLTVPDVMKPKIKRLANGDSPWNDGWDPRRFEGSELRAIQAHGGEEWSPHISDITPERVSEAHELGLRVGVWGVSTAAEIAAMTALGVEALTVSGPDWSA